jgi:D-3-phosphoglycerate dehydrogenase
VLAEAILLLRGIPEKNASCHRGGWIKSAANSFEIRGKKLGIVGYGSIGTQLSVLAEGLGMQVFFYDTVTKLPLGNATQVSSLHELLGMSDIVTLHVPETAATQWMIGEKEIRAIKKGGILINAARGTVVELDALADAIKDKHLIGAAIDVFPVEPRSNDEEFESPLRGLDNVILTPHIGGSTAEAQANIGLEVGKTGQVQRQRYFGIVGQLPEVALPAHPGKHRLLHIHENIPGVMSEINKVFAENGINISGQFLQTNEKVGYVVIDVDAEYSDWRKRSCNTSTAPSVAACCSKNAPTKKTGAFKAPVFLFHVNRDDFRGDCRVERHVVLVAGHQLQGVLAGVRVSSVSVWALPKCITVGWPGLARWRPAALWSISRWW